MVDTPSGARAVARCDALGVAPYSDMAGGLFRAWLTPAFAATQRQVADWMAEAGMAVRTDAATNLIGRYEGTTPGAPVLLIGSHLDSVRDAGRYDGPLGVMLGIELVASLAAAGTRLPFAIEVIGFGDEEGSRFPAAMLTSRAVAGTLDIAALDGADVNGVSVTEALAAYTSLFPGEGRGPVTGRSQLGQRGVEHAPRAQGSSGGRSDPALLRRGTEENDAVNFPTARRTPAEILAYLEAHIEQGPALEAEGLPLGVVTGIAGQIRYHIAVTGTAGHAGTTSMTLRRDALTAAAAMVLEVERIARDAASDLVATVGRLTVAPGAVNVIPGRANFTLDVRSGDDAVCAAAAENILDALMTIAEARGVEIAIQRTHALPASPCDPKLMDLLDRSVQDQGLAVRRLVSGAGHDAMVMAALCPTAMLFIRCAGGVSHNPAEAVDPVDVEAALQAMIGFAHRLGDTV
ncbi:allantoate amidohydrolase [soil metagenome]